MICFNCKAQLPDGVSFCTECGYRQLAQGADVGATQAMDFDATQMAPIDATQAAPFAVNQPVDFDATQAAPFGATQAMPYDDATQAAPFAVNQPVDFDATQAAPLGATQAMPYDDATQAAPYAAAQPVYDPAQAAGYPPQDYGYYAPPVAPPPAEPSQKNGKGILIAVAGAVAVLAVVAGVLAYQFIPDLGGPEKKSKKDKAEEESTTAVTTVTKPDTDSELVITIPEMTAPVITAPGIIGGEGEGLLVPTVPHGNDTVDIGSLDLFKPTQAPVAPPTTRPKPSTPSATRPQPTNPPATQGYYNDYTNSYAPPSEYYDEYLEEPYALVDPYADCVHIGVNTYEDDGSAFYREYGYFYKGENLCLFMAAGGESAIVEVDESSGEMSAYLNEGSGYYEIDTTQEKCEEVKTHIIAMLVELGYDADHVYPEYKYEYLGDDYMDDFGNAEFYDVYDNNYNYFGSIVVDEGTGYYIGVFDENEELVYLSKFIDRSGSELPYNFR